MRQYFAWLLSVQLALIGYGLMPPSANSQPEKWQTNQDPLTGSWRNDKQSDHLTFDGKNGVVFTHVWGTGDSMQCPGTYEMIGANRIRINANSKMYEGSFTASDLTLKDTEGKITTYLRGWPVISTPKDQAQTIVATFEESTDPKLIEDSLKKLNPVYVTLYEPHAGQRTIAVRVEEEVLDKQLSAARLDKTFKTVKAAGLPGEDRVEKPGVPLVIGDSLVNLRYSAKPTAQTQAVEKLLKELGTPARDGTLSLPPGRLLSAFVSLKSSGYFDFVGPAGGSNCLYCINVRVNEDTPADKLGQALLQLKPEYLRFLPPKENVRVIKVDVSGPVGLERALRLARSNPAFQSVEIPSVEDGKRNSFTPHMLNAFDDFEKPYNELMIYRNPNVSQQTIDESIKRLGGEVLEAKTAYLIRFDKAHVIGAYWKAIHDKSFLSIHQNMKLEVP